MKKSIALAALMAIPLIVATGLVHADKAETTADPGEAAWMTDYKKAFEEAKAEKKYVMIDFSGSTWCTPCIALQKEVFSTKQFQDYAKSKFVLVKVDFPDPVEPPRAYGELIEKYLPQILLPTVVITSPDGTKLGQTGYYPGGPDVFIASVQKIIKK